MQQHFSRARVGIFAAAAELWKKKNVVTRRIIFSSAFYSAGYVRSSNARPTPKFQRLCSIAVRLFAFRSDKWIV